MNSTGETWRLGRRPALDGLRGLAVLLVVACHANIPGLHALGAVGVTVFFTLSGFLITSLLLDEHASRGQLRLGRFYGRRVLRLFPALFACIVVTAVVGSFVAGLVPRIGVVAASVHLTNWVEIAYPQHWLGALSHTWSLAVEEQFYLVWPAVLGLALASRWRETAVLTVACTGSVAAVVLRFALWDGGTGWARVAYGSDTHADALLVGCALAVVVRRVHFERRPGLALGCVAAITGLGLVGGFAGAVLVPTVVPFLTAACVGAVLGGSRVLTWGPLMLLGRRSYGLYLWHYPVAVLVGLRFGDAWLPQVVLMVPAALVLTALSWRYVETPFLRLKDQETPVCLRTNSNETTMTPLVSG